MKINLNINFNLYIFVIYFPTDKDTDDEPVEDEPANELLTFLAVLNLTDYYPIFKQEKMDLEAVMMATDTDLKALGLSMGPRLKILRAMDARKSKMESEKGNHDTAF